MARALQSGPAMSKRPSFIATRLALLSIAATIALAASILIIPSASAAKRRPVASKKLARSKVRPSARKSALRPRPAARLSTGRTPSLTAGRVPAARTIQEIEAVRFLELPFEIVKDQVTDLLAADPALAGMSPDRLADLAGKILGFESRGKTVKQVIEESLS